MRILIVEDNPDTATTLRMLLSALGHETQIVMDGETALVVVPKFKPHSVILDLGLPGMQGHETSSRIRALDEGKGIQIIVLSGWGDEEHRERSRFAGVDHHLAKPLNLDVLKRLLDEHPTYFGALSEVPPGQSDGASP